MKDAVDAERAGCTLTCQAIIRHVIGTGVEDEDKKATWLEDADSFAKQENNYDEARKIFTEGIKKCPGAVPLWLLLSRLEELPETNN
ncbi:hypothetical protein KIN20_030495 [Parelaphostrongylus tenuis]|uniref:Uncharacterized protein n=1 Tax=Parelaphostrongylus tenuis TaxID=148309 RepID=A0AAD5R3U8_PARTN|nr:hypothetical protein KIN20_030495 [Parelaphostrongylus tenuis]